MINDKALFDEELNKMLSDPRIQRLREFPQHHGSNTLDHSIAVAKRSFDLAEKFRWRIDERELVRSAMLHDYYLYDIKEEGLSAYNHGTSHPVVAIRNADREFTLTEKEMSDIRSHMWPLTFMHPPRSKEAALLCIADKDIAVKEFAGPEIRRAKRIARILGTKPRKKSNDERKTDHGKHL